MDAADIARRFYGTLEARDWEAFAALLADDVVYEVPQTRERVRGRDAYVRFNPEFPGDWHLSLHRVVADGDQVAVWARATLDGVPQDNLAFLTVADGRVTAVADFWPDPYEPPADRPAGVERY
jgi:ketosteroid isomerase-like protein